MKRYEEGASQKLLIKINSEGLPDPIKSAASDSSRPNYTTPLGCLWPMKRAPAAGNLINFSAVAFA
jgi:hypothetical protein